jgi:hypothetical protein
MNEDFSSSPLPLAIPTIDLDAEPSSRVIVNRAGAPKDDSTLP